jgi:hypothetical protein
MADRTAADRVKRYRRRLVEQHGLARVEVLVPRDKVAAVRSYAAQLRAPKRSQMALDRLVDEAIERFAPTCLWNVDVSRRDAVMREVIVSRLRKHGGHEGWRLAAEIERAARQTAG